MTEEEKNQLPEDELEKVTGGAVTHDQPRVCVTCNGEGFVDGKICPSCDGMGRFS